MKQRVAVIVIYFYADINRCEQHNGVGFRHPKMMFLLQYNYNMTSILESNIAVKQRFDIYLLKTKEVTGYADFGKRNAVLDYFP